MRPFHYFLPWLAACTSPASSTDVVGPFTGDVHRFVIDRFDLPHNNNEARQTGADLTGDGTTDNQLGMVFGSLAGQGDLTLHSVDMIDSGALQSWIEVQADDFTNDPTVGVRYVGAPGTSFTVMGGSLVDGVFTSNKTITSDVPGAAALRLPVLADADPSAIDAYAMQMSFRPASDGTLTALVQGAVDPLAARAAIVSGIRQMVAANPTDHWILMQLFDSNHDYQLSTSEIENNNFIASLLSPDLDLFDRGDYSPGHGDGWFESLSFGFSIHLVPCASGTCAGVVADHCHDRAVDGDESDVDCGGSCNACPGTSACVAATDCQSHMCNVGGCAAPSCTDGVEDGFETDVDCGGNCGSTCAIGQRCSRDGDCTTTHCNGNTCSIYPS